MPKPPYIALGLMSGTSLDGVDAAFLETDGERIIRFGPSLTTPYSAGDCETLTQATKAALRWQFKGAVPNSFMAAEDVIHAAHVAAVKSLCEAYPDWAKRLDMIGFHGQTVLHHPAKDGVSGKTLQLGDGQRLADECGVPVYYDFRSDDVAAGGQGAPLAPIYHKALTECSELTGSVGVLNIGGVSNVTLVDGQEIMATDCGPGNGPLDNWMEMHAGQAYDVGGMQSMRGVPSFVVIEQWLRKGFFRLGLPRSADRYDFDVAEEIGEMSVENGAATLSAFMAIAVSETLSKGGAVPQSLIVCGGGRRNKAMLWMLKEHVQAAILTAESVGWDGDAIEAEAFAYLAVRSKLGLPISFPKTTGVATPMTGGRVAYPS